LRYILLFLIKNCCSKLSFFYLKNKYKLQGCNLLPDEKLAIVLQRAFEALNLQKICNENIIYYIWRTSAEKIDAGYLSEKKKELRKELDRWEQNLSQVNE